MPLVNVKMIEGVFTPTQKQERSASSRTLLQLPLNGVHKCDSF